MTQSSIEDLIKNKMEKAGNRMALHLSTQVLSQLEEGDQREECLLLFNQGLPKE